MARTSTKTRQKETPASAASLRACSSWTELINKHSTAARRWPLDLPIVFRSSHWVPRSTRIPTHIDQLLVISSSTVPLRRMLDQYY